VRSDASPRSFEIHSAVWYRTNRDSEWRAGVSRCISMRSAVIHTDEPPSVFDLVDIVIPLSDTGCLVGRGRVNRAQLTSGTGPSADFSVTVDRYTLTHHT
jgi:hypothetical protein